MTKYTAYKKAHDLWGVNVAVPGTRVGHVKIRQKKHAKRFEVGYVVSVGRIAPSKGFQVMGRGDSWEQAFSDAAKNAECEALHGAQPPSGIS